MANLSDYGARFNRITATGDKGEAAALLREVQIAVADGSARGFEGDMAKLATIAGVPLAKVAPSRPMPLEKAAARPALPPHLEALAKDAIARIHAACSPMEKRAANSHGLEIKRRCDDFHAETAIRAVHAQPKGRMF